MSYDQISARDLLSTGLLRQQFPAKIDQKDYIGISHKSLELN